MQHYCIHAYHVSEKSTIYVYSKVLNNGGINNLSMIRDILLQSKCIKSNMEQYIRLGSHGRTDRQMMYSITSIIDSRPTKLIGSNEFAVPSC